MRALKKPSLRPVKRCGDGRIRRPSRRREGPGLPRAEVEGEANSPEPDETNDETGNGRVRVPSSLLQLQSDPRPAALSSRGAASGSVFCWVGCWLLCRVASACFLLALASGRAGRFVSLSVWAQLSVVLSVGRRVHPSSDRFISLSCSGSSLVS